MVLGIFDLVVLELCMYFLPPTKLSFLLLTDVTSDAGNEQKRMMFHPKKEKERSSYFKETKVNYGQD